MREVCGAPVRMLFAERTGGTVQREANEVTPKQEVCRERLIAFAGLEIGGFHSCLVRQFGQCWENNHFSPPPSGGSARSLFDCLIWDVNLQ